MNLCIDRQRAQYPVAIPEFLEFHFCDEDGNFCSSLEKEMTQEDFDSIEFSTNHPYELKFLSQKLSPHIKFGWIEIACSANEKSRYSYFQTLRINSDGSASKINNWAGPCIESINEQESYVPSN